MGDSVTDAAGASDPIDSTKSSQLAARSRPCVETTVPKKRRVGLQRASMHPQTQLSGCKPRQSRASSFPCQDRGHFCHPRHGARPGMRGGEAGSSLPVGRPAGRRQTRGFGYSQMDEDGNSAVGLRAGRSTTRRTLLLLIFLRALGARKGRWCKGVCVGG